MSLPVVAEPLPTSFTFGKVVGRVIHLIADTAEDTDDKPQARAAAGKVTFTPKEVLRKTTEAEYPAIVLHAPETATLSNSGRILDAEGRQGIWLATGIYTVTFEITKAPRAIPSFDIEVTTAHTDAEPLDLAAAVPYVPPTGTVVQTVVVPSGGTTGQVLARTADGSLAWADKGGAPTGGAGGALSGTYPNPGLNETALDNASAAIVADDTSATSGALRAAFALGEGAAPTDTVVASFLTEGTITRGVLDALFKDAYPVNVLHYGADPTGATDSTPAFAAALAALIARRTIAKLMKTSSTSGPGTAAVGKGCVYVPAGHYQVTGFDLTGLDGIIMRGDGPGTVIENTATDGSHGIQAVNPLTAADTTNWLGFYDFMVVGNAASGDGIHLRNVDFLSVDHVWTQEHGRDGFHYTTTGLMGLENKSISHLWSQFNGRDGLSLTGTHDMMVSDSHLEENTRHGLYGASVTNLHVSNTNIEDNFDANDVYLTDQRQVHFDNVIVEGNVYVAMGGPYAAHFANSGLGTFEFQGGPTGELFWSNNRATILAMVAGTAVFAGGRVTYGAGTTDIHATLQATGVRIGVAASATHTIRPAANNAQINIQGGTQGGGDTTSKLAIDATGFTGARVNLGGWNSRVLDAEFRAIAYLKLCASLLAGGAAWEVFGAGTLTDLGDLTLIENNVLRIKTGRTGAIYLTNIRRDGTGAVTDETTTAVLTNVS